MTRALVFICHLHGSPNDIRNASKTSSFQESDQAFLLASRRLIFPAHLHFGSELVARQHLEINGHARRPPGGCETDPAQGSDVVSSVMFCERVQTAKHACPSTGSHLLLSSKRDYSIGVCLFH